MSTPLITFFLLTLYLLISFSPTLTFSIDCNKYDKQALINIANHFGNPPALAQWRIANVSCCDWPGIQCYRDSNRVRNLQFIGLDLKGTIPSSIGNLPELQSIQITNVPNIAGSIPSSITKLKKLVYLEISNGSLSGPIPDFLSEVTSLTFLDLSRNRLSGSIPPSLPNLQVGALLLDFNQLTGPIPDFSKFGDGNIFLSHNKLSGPIPPSLGRLGWSQLDLSHNLLAGDASFLFGSNRSAIEILLDHNKLSFDLTHVSFPEKLTILTLNNNFIYGSIPAQINSVTFYGLTKFNVAHNMLCGEIPGGAVTAQFGISAYMNNKCLCGKPLPACKS